MSQRMQSEGIEKRGSMEAGKNKVEETLDSLVTSGTITEDQESAIKSAMENAIRSSAYTRYKIQSASTDTSATASKVNPLDSLVESETITQEQADAIKQALEDSMQSKGMPPPPPDGSTLADILDSLVTEGTISEEQETSISSVFQSAIKAYMTQSDAAENLWNTTATEISV